MIRKMHCRQDSREIPRSRHCYVPFFFSLFSFFRVELAWEEWTFSGKAVLLINETGNAKSVIIFSNWGYHSSNYICTNLVKKKKTKEEQGEKKEEIEESDCLFQLGTIIFFQFVRIIEERRDKERAR